MLSLGENCHVKKSKNGAKLGEFASPVTSAKSFNLAG